MQHPTPSGRPSEAATGVLYTTGAFLLWGLAPIFWKALEQVPATSLLAYRVVFCALIMAVLLGFSGRFSEVPRVLRPGRTLWALLGSTALIGGNWFLFIWAVNSGKILEASLGYYINPLINVLLGVVFLGEQLRGWQRISVGLAAVGVLILTWNQGELPWISLTLAFSFGLYGLLRKTVAAGPEVGLTIEAWLLTPLALLYLVRLHGAGEGTLGQGDLITDLLLVATGLITAIPLLWFTHGARRLPLSTVGLLQYLAPTGQFLLGVFLFHEPFSLAHLLAFVVIWSGLAIFTFDARAQWRRPRRLAEETSS